MSQITYDNTAKANTRQMSQGLIMQAYFNSVLQQPRVNLSGLEKVQKFEEKINSELNNAASTADYYLNTLQTEIIRNSTSFQEFLTLSAVVPTVLPSGTSSDVWIRTLQAVIDEAIIYKKQSNITKNNIMGVHKQLTSQSQFLNGITGEMNIVVGGDTGLLNDLSQQIADINSQAAGLITGIVVGVLTTVAGSLAIAVGAIAGFVTGGTSTTAVVGGVAALAAGISTLAGTSLTLSNLYAAQSDLYQNKSRLTEEVKLTSSLSNGLSALQQRASQAVTAATQMSTAWESLISSTSSYINNLKEGTMAADVLREIFLKTANETIPVLSEDLSIIRQQMSGVSMITLPSGTNLTEYMKNYY